MVKMAIPGKDKTRHGLTRVIEEDEEYDSIWDAEIRKTDELFRDIVTVNYIKIDIEGFEDRVLPGFSSVIESNSPVLQIEVDPANNGKITSFLSEFGYTAYTVHHNKLIKIEDKGRGSDIIYLTEKLTSRYNEIIASQ